MKHHLWALGFSGLLGLACLVTWGLSGPTAALTILGGGAVPAVISWGSMALLVDRPAGFDPQRHERSMLINFFVKVLALGIWTTIVLVNLDWSPALFSVALLVNFLAWHLLEAMVYQKQLVNYRASAVEASQDQN